MLRFKPGHFKIPNNGPIPEYSYTASQVRVFPEGQSTLTKAERITLTFYGMLYGPLFHTLAEEVREDEAYYQTRYNL